MKRASSNAGNNRTSPQKDTPLKVRPEAAAEFRTTREDCFREYRKAVKLNAWTDRRRMMNVQAEDFRPVYVPCAMFDAWVSGDTVTTGSTSAEVNGDTVVSQFDTNIRLHYRYEKLLVSRVPGIASRTVRVEPDALEEYDPKTTDGTEVLPTAAFNAETLVGRARNIVARNARNCVMHELEDKYRNIRYSRISEAVTAAMTSVQYMGDALIPAWILERGKGKRRRYTVMNGVTGEIWTVPVMNRLRYLLTAGYAGLLLSGLLYLLFRFALKLETQWIPAVAIGLPAGLLIALAIGTRKLTADEPDGVPLRPVNKGLKTLSHKLTLSHRISSDDD